MPFCWALFLEHCDLLLQRWWQWSSELLSKPNKIKRREPLILYCLSAAWHRCEMVQCSTKSTIFSCFQGDVLCDIDNCINPWFTQSAGKETAPFLSAGFLIAQWSVIYRHLNSSPFCMHVHWGQNQWSNDHFSTINDSWTRALLLDVTVWLIPLCLYLCEVCLHVKGFLCK